MKKLLFTVFIISYSFTASAQWGEISNWFNQAVSDVNQASKEVENSYNLVNAQVQASTQQFVNDIENFAVDFANGSMKIINNCKDNSAPVYETLESAVKAEANKIATSPNSPSQAICDECIKNATLQFICRVPETIQGNMAFMDKMQSMAKDSRVSHLQTPIKEISGVALGTFDDFSNEFQYYFNLLGSLSSQLDPTSLKYENKAMTEKQMMEMIFSKSNCEALGDQAFDSMMGALKSKAEKEKAKKRYAALLKMLNGFGNMETVSGWNDKLNQIGSLLPQSEAAKNIPTENPLYNSGGAENVFINASGNSLWVDARNWSKQMVPLPYQVAYIPKGKKVIADRPVSIRTIIDDNPNGGGVDGRGNITLTDDPYNGRTFAIQAKHSGHYFAVAGDSKVKGGNITQWNNPDHGSHHFQFISTGDGDGTYYIKSKWSGLNLDVFGPSVENGANLGQWTASGWDNQKFSLEKAGGGYYYIRSKHSGKVMDVSGCHKNVGTNVQQWDKVPSADCQMFALVAKNENPIDNSTYYNGHTFAIQAKHSGHYFAVSGDSKVKGGNIVQWNNPDHGSHHFQLLSTGDGDGSYRIKSKWSGLNLDVFSPSLESGANLGQWTPSSLDNQKFYLEDAGGGYYVIRSKYSGKVLDVNGINKNVGANIQQWDEVSGAESQMFRLVPKTLSGQVFFIETKMVGGKVLDKQGNSSNVYLFQKHGGVNQQFLFQLAEIENGKEWYYMINRENQGYLHNQGYGVQNGTNIMTLTDHQFGNDWATMFGLEKYDDQHYYIKSRFTKDIGNGVWDGGRYFDLSGCKNDNGTNLQLYDKVDGANCQLFKLVKAN